METLNLILTIVGILVSFFGLYSLVSHFNGTLMKKLYKFKSPKSHQWYMVWVECYRHHFYAVKFHLKNHRYSDNKYRYMTKLNEARQVIHTCINIMLEIAMEDDLSSFGFIGANSIGESIKETKRFQVYKILMATYFSEEHF